MARLKKRKKSRFGRGKQLVLLALLLGLVGWNYQRNRELEKERPRPYASYGDAELAQLRAAYEGQVSALESRYAGASTRRSRPRETEMVGEAVEEFQRVQRASRSVRELGSQLSQEQASLEAIREEQALRTTMGAGLAKHVRLAFRF